MCGDLPPDTRKRPGPSSSSVRGAGLVSNTGLLRDAVPQLGQVDETIAPLRQVASELDMPTPSGARDVLRELLDFGAHRRPEFRRGRDERVAGGT